MTTKLVSTALLILSFAAAPALAANQSDGQSNRSHTTIKLIKKLRSDNTRLPIKQLLGKHVTSRSQAAKDLNKQGRQAQASWLSESAR